jgi:hypothetical protein
MSFHVWTRPGRSCRIVVGTSGEASGQAPSVAIGAGGGRRFPNMSPDLVGSFDHNFVRHRYQTGATAGYVVQ